MGRIKLIIWDLDDTLWQGTLSEEGITEKPAFTQAIIQLAHRGIISSVCSKNDYEPAKAKLVELGVWEYIVFASIDWTNKGARIQQIIRDMSLQSKHVLFVDDNINNLQEAQYIMPDLQVATPQQLEDMLATHSLQGAEDNDCKRLGQYKILEKKHIAQSSYASNEDFLFHSNIQVYLHKDVGKYHTRIYELIHRTNQLNYTKNRISQQQWQCLSQDASVQQCCIQVVDMYGDHGIVGYYAVRDNRLVQYVLSCRVLGMGIEQWVYAMLGFPAIDIVEPIAVQLNRQDMPLWINQQQGDTQCNSTTQNTDSSIILYGACFLRPVWAYIEPVVANAHFAEIDPDPSICNIPAILRVSDTVRQYWLDSVNTFDDQYTFDRAIFDASTDYVMINLIAEKKQYKYTKDGNSFYSAKLTEQSATPTILAEYTESTLSNDDIEESLQYICSNLSSNTTLLIQLVPEVVFPTMGEDEDYINRVALNQIARNIANMYNNVLLIDICQYANEPMHFYNLSASHYNRAIGYKLAKDVLTIMGVSQGNNDTEYRGKHSRAIVDNHIWQGHSFVTDTNIVNGVLHMQLQHMPLDVDNISVTVMRDRLVELHIDNLTGTNIELRIDRAGLWSVMLCITSGQSSKSYSTRCIDYNAFNYLLYTDNTEANYASYMGSLDEFISENVKYASFSNEFIGQIAELQAVGVSVAHYFADMGITEISVFVDEAIGSVLLPFLLHSSVKVKTIYTTGIRQAFAYDGGMSVVMLEDMNGPLALSQDEHLLFAIDGKQRWKWISMFGQCNVHMHYLPYILSVLKTKKFFCDRVEQLHLPRTICMRGVKAEAFFAFPYTSISSRERSACKAMGNIYQAYNRLSSGGQLPATLADKSLVQLQQTMNVPQYYTDIDTKITTMIDCHGEYCNIQDGFRRVVGQEPADRKIYIYGTTYVYGLGVSDSDTMASQLQMLVGSSYQVVNCSNACNEIDYDNIIRLMMNTTYNSQDIIVLFMTNWQSAEMERRWHWLNYDTCEQYMEHIDTFPMFADSNREDYLLYDGAYNEICLGKLARLISNKIEDKI